VEELSRLDFLCN